MELVPALAHTFLTDFRKFLEQQCYLEFQGLGKYTQEVCKV